MDDPHDTGRLGNCEHVDADGELCPVCGTDLVFSPGGGIDQDRFICRDAECDYEREEPGSTWPDEYYDINRH